MNTELNNTVINEVPDFRVGDTVYYMDTTEGCVKAKIIEFRAETSYPILIIGEEGSKHSFTIDGKFQNIHTVPLLSHTPYDLINGGFSQRMKKVLPDIPVDTLVYVRNRNRWKMNFFAEWRNGKMQCWINQLKSHETNLLAPWNEWSLTNPLEYK